MNSADTHNANSKAISFCAKAPPDFPDFTFIPAALVSSIHLFGERVNAFLPASCVSCFHASVLNSGLLSISQSPKKSIVSRFLSQFLTTSFGSLLLIWLY
ncbi:MAG: hypothetical protein Q4Q25_00520, partial [Methanocorpusculum sp.]|nr:hypothetical protein [Methanocorpusculum sp.]